MPRFQVRAEETIGRARPRYAVVDTENRDLPVAHFDHREDAEAHAGRLEQGPFDWDEQEAWQDEWEDDEDDWSS